MHIAALNPLAINTDDIDPEILKKEEELISEELKNLGKPEDIVKKISIGKINKFKEENSLIKSTMGDGAEKKSEGYIKRIKFR